MKRTATQKGFTLVETLVAISILMVAILGPMSIAGQGLKTSYTARQQVVAIYLAQEAIESFHYLRNEEALEQRYAGGDPNVWEWVGSIHADCKNGTGCDYDRIDGQYISCAGPNSCTLKTNLSPTNNGIQYGYDTGWEDSIFTRKIYVDDTNSDQVDVRVEVTWSGPFSSGQKVELYTTLYNQYAP